MLNRLIASFNMEFVMPVEWDKIEAVRQVLSAQATALIADVEIVDALAMVSVELLENAVKYSDPIAGVPIGLELSVDRRRFAVAVSNTTGAASKHSAKLLDRLGMLKSHANPMDAYLHCMRDIYEGKIENGGLGLARIMAEGGCELDCDVQPSGRITVSAQLAR